ncbi:pleckstrin homology domain-containing family A member 3 [Bombina bombina]|uniref:pleckstrin homology domain-containing family A member 3 n=1 Tax=Bombina bombina TaxID=8345 RepID=UPI00235AEA6D|nr:pleckstrin homology domain-containing family A member 3 [Bombina bombina]
MEGSLLKWTNYLSGWQPRYFVLDSGILSYYDSQEDVGKGNKGSIKMAVCEIRVHSSDRSRVDLIIPREQCFYLRAENAVERQRWLVALGSAKACLGDSTSQRAKEAASDGETMVRKLSELRIFCDLLMQQVVEVQGAVHPDETGASPDKEKLNSACSLLHDICSHIYSTLEECMNHVSTNMHSGPQHPPLPVLPADVVGTKLPQARKGKSTVKHSVAPKTQRGPGTLQHDDGTTVLKNLEDIAMRSRSRKYNSICPPENHLPDIQTDEYVRAPVTIK